MADTEPKTPRPLRERLPEKKFTRAIVAPFLAAEWCFEWADYWTSQMALFHFLGNVARLSILVAVISYFWTCGARERAAQDARTAKHYQAWQVILAAEGKVNAAGRTDALEDLNADRVNLSSVNLRRAFLDSIRLPGATLREATMDSTSLTGADFTNASLARADLGMADLTGANLKGANLEVAVLMGANLAQANLAQANLHNANFWAVRNPPSGLIESAVRDRGAVCVKFLWEWLGILFEHEEWSVNPDTVQDFEELCNVQYDEGGA